MPGERSYFPQKCYFSSFMILLGRCCFNYGQQVALLLLKEVLIHATHSACILLALTKITAESDATSLFH
jgi:hypothetical protein